MPSLSCPNNPDHTEFETTAHVMELWKVDESGQWVETLQSLETSQPPDFHGNTVTCCECGADAVVSD